MDILVAGNVFSLIMDGKLNDPNYLSNGKYLSPSYSIDPTNPYRSSYEKTYDYSGYFTPVRPSFT
jgi:hypothetical protein